MPRKNKVDRQADLERARAWLYSLPAYLNRELGYPVTPVKVVQFPARTS